MCSSGNAHVLRYKNVLEHKDLWEAASKGKIFEAPGVTERHYVERKIARNVVGKANVDY